jgi:hypothetical protein
MNTPAIQLQHVRTREAIKDRRFAAQFRVQSVPATLCGKPITALDLTPSEARKSLTWPTLCPDCKKGMELG